MKSTNKPYKSESSLRFIEEAPTTYYVENIATPLAEMTSIQKMKIIKKGISKSYLEMLKKSTSLDYDSLAEALSVTRSTLINKKGSERFSNQISEKIIALADLYSFGYETFEDKEKFNNWMRHPNQSLNGLTPLELIDNIYGREEVKNLIGRIAHGVYS